MSYLEVIYFVYSRLQLLILSSKSTPKQKELNQRLLIEAGNAVIERHEKFLNLCNNKLTGTPPSFS